MNRRSFLGFLATLAGIPFVVPRKGSPAPVFIGNNAPAHTYNMGNLYGPAHRHTITDLGHTHQISDPGHEHHWLEPGTISTYYGNEAPPGWLKCDGKVISRRDYPELANAIFPPGKNGFQLPEIHSHALVSGEHGEVVGQLYIIKT